MVEPLVVIELSPPVPTSMICTVLLNQAMLHHSYRVPLMMAIQDDHRIPLGSILPLYPIRAVGEGAVVEAMLRIVRHADLEAAAFWKVFTDPPHVCADFFVGRQHDSEGAVLNKLFENFSRARQQARWFAQAVTYTVPGLLLSTVRSAAALALTH